MGNDVDEKGQWKLVSRRRNKKLKFFSKTKGKARSSAGTLGIPFSVSGPRPLQEARVFVAETVPAGFYSVLIGLLVLSWSGLPRAGVHVFKGPVFESASRVTRAGITALKGAVEAGQVRLCDCK